MRKLAKNTLKGSVYVAWFVLVVVMIAWLLALAIKVSPWFLLLGVVAVPILIFALLVIANWMVYDNIWGHYNA